jgi:hypothetical protein
MSRHYRGGELLQSEFVESYEQSLLDSFRRARGLNAFGQAAQLQAYCPFIFESAGTTFTSVGMLNCRGACVRIEYLLASDVIDYVFKSLAIHAKHLADSSSLFDAQSFGEARNFSIKMVRPRCNLDRTVPIAQPSTAAASA